MKEVDPEGFSKRRPKWTSTAPGSNSTHLVPQTRLDSPPSNHSDLPSTSHSFSYPPYSEVQMQPYLVTPPATARLPQMIETQESNMESNRASDILQTGLAMGRDGIDSRPSHPAASADDPAPEAPIQEVGTDGTNGASSMITPRQDPVCSIRGHEFPVADVIEDAEICNANDTDSVCITTDESETDDSWDELDDMWGEQGQFPSILSYYEKFSLPSVYPLISEPPPPGFWGAIANASVEDQITQICRLELRHTVRDLLVQLNKWCAAPVVDVSAPPATSSMSGTLDTPIQVTEQRRSREDVQKCVTTSIFR